MKTKDTLINLHLLFLNKNGKVVIVKEIAILTKTIKNQEIVLLIIKLHIKHTIIPIK